MALVRPPPTAPIVEHVHIPPSLLELLRRPEPMNPPTWIRTGGEVKSATLPIPHREERLHRDVHFFVPNAKRLSRRSKGDIPLLIAFHGSTEHGLLFRASTSSYAYDELACEEGFIVAYPDGYKGKFCLLMSPTIPYLVHPLSSSDTCYSVHIDRQLRTRTRDRPISIVYSLFSLTSIPSLDFLLIEIG